MQCRQHVGGRKENELAKNMDLKEERVDSVQLADGVLLKAYRDRVRLHDGTISVREWIDHPGASAVVPIFPDGSTILVRQFRYPPRREFLEVPAGKLDKEGEPPDEVARRELEEETGWRCESLTELGKIYPCIGYSSEIIYFYLAENLSKGERSLEDGENLVSVRMPFAEAVAMARRGQMLDMKTLSALVLADERLRTREKN